MNNSGKATTILIAVIIVLLLCATGISGFFFIKEVELRRAAENNYEQLQNVESSLQTEISEAKKQMHRYEEQVKEHEDKIESLMEEIELAEGLKDELKGENRNLQDQLKQAQQEKEQIQDQWREELQASRDRISELEQELAAAQREIQNLETPISVEEATPMTDPASEDAGESQVDLEKIVVSPPEPANEGEGKVISVDLNAEFLIVDVGEKQGIQKDDVLSIYRGETYLGDVKVSRVLPEMSAADFIPPLKSDLVEKDDRVVVKK